MFNLFSILAALGLGDSIADVRELYQARQASGKTKRVTYDETKYRDEVDASTQIRSYPMAASETPIAPESQKVDLLKSVIVKQTKDIKCRCHRYV